MSKGLEVLEKLKKEHIFIDFELDFDIGEQYKDELNIIEKELKALEIIKKNVRIVDYSEHTIANGNLVILRGGEIKTREEYELLREVLL